MYNIDKFTDQIPGVSSMAWKEVAKMKATNLTMAIVDSSGGDQMSIAHTRTHFSDTVISWILMMIYQS